MPHSVQKGTIPEALKAIRMQDSTAGSALVFVVKVKDATAEITGADIVGTVSETGERTGLKLFETAGNKYGFEPMIYIAPRYSALDAVKQELIVITEKTEAMAYIDTPDGWGFNQAIESRGAEGDFATLKAGQKLFPRMSLLRTRNITRMSRTQGKDTSRSRCRLTRRVCGPKSI